MMKCSIEGRGCQVGREQLGREWKNGRGVLSLSESLSLFFPLPRLTAGWQAHDRKLPSQAPHTTKTRPAHKLDTERTRCGKVNECASSAVGMERASTHMQTQK
jgi:hypothetical protein